MEWIKIVWLGFPLWLWIGLGLSALFLGGVALNVYCDRQEVQRLSTLESSRKILCEKLNGKGVIVVWRYTDGKKTDYETMFVSLLVEFGAKVVNVPSAVAKQIWENRSDLNKTTRADLYFIATIRPDQHYDTWRYVTDLSLMSSGMERLIGGAVFHIWDESSLGSETENVIARVVSNVTQSS